MLIKRKDRETHRRPLADALPHSPGGFDRRTFLRRSGLAAGGLTPRPGRRRLSAPKSPSARTSARTARSAAR